MTGRAIQRDLAVDRLIEVPIANEAALRARQRFVSIRGDFGRRAGGVPDPHFIDHAVEGMLPLRPADKQRRLSMRRSEV
jgi:hypothetical protein